MKPGRTARIGLATSLIGLILLGLPGCGGRSPRSLVVITIDTLRADRLGCYGNPHGLTPNLDRLAAQGVLFEDATAVAPITLPAHASLFTGRYPPATGVRNNGTFVLPEGELTLAELLSESGWATGAVIGAFPLQSRFGLAQGFERYDEQLPPLARAAGRGLPVHFPERNARAVSDRAIEVWRELDPRRRFVWVHYFDPHAPYAPPEPYAARSEDAYDGEVAFVDAEVGRLIRAIEQDDPDAIFVVIADHGEGLADHGEKTHGVLLYQTTMHVPFLLRAPGRLPSGRRVTTPVSQVDLLPTLLALLKLPLPADLHGADLRPAIGAGDAPSRPVYGETLVPRLEYRFSELTLLRRGRLKYIDAPLPELYDLARDPGETTNLHPQQPDEAEMAAELRELLSRTDVRGSDRAGQILDAEAEASLRSLGYLASGTLAREATEGRGRDPKEMTDYIRRYDRAVGLISSGRLDDGVARLRELLPEAPENFMARFHIAAGLSAAGQLREAEQELKIVVSEAPALAGGHLMLAETLAGLGRYEEAISSYRAAADTGPGDVEPLLGLGGVLESIGRREEAADAYHEAIGRDPNGPEAPRRLLALRHEDRVLDKAIEELLRLLDEHPRSANLWTAVAMGERGRGDPAAALSRLRQALAIDPRHHDALVQVGEIQLDNGRHDLAETAFRRAVNARPGQLESHFGLARALLEQGRTLEAEAQFSLVLQIEPGFSSAHTARGDYLERRGDLIGAAEAYRRALQLNRADRQAWEGLRRVTGSR